METSRSETRIDGLHRRTVLRAGAAGIAGLSVVGAASGQAGGSGQVRRIGGAATAGVAGGRARNVIFMVADGMSSSTLSLGHLWVRRREQRESEWVRLWSRPGARRAAQQTYALDSLVTDSASAASAWGCGAHVNNRAVNVLPRGKQLLPIGPHARQGGKRLGLVTNTRLTDATPAAFVANAAEREWEGLIAQQMMERGFDVAIGGGGRNFPEALLKEHPSVEVVHDWAGVQSASGERPLLGLLASSHMPYEIERPEGAPTLADMTARALALLERPGGEGFLLQVEGARVDHAAHGNEAASLVREMAEFDRALGAVLGWMEGRDDTLLIVTTDHANANPGLTVYGKKASEGFDSLTRATRSFDWIDARLGAHEDKAARAAAAPGLVREACGVGLDATEEKMLGAAIMGERVHPFGENNEWTSVLGAVLANHCGVSFVSPNHTSDLTELVAIGPGSERIGAYVDNVELHGVMIAAMGLPEGRMLEGMDEPMVLPRRSGGGAE